MMYFIKKFFFVFSLIFIGLFSTPISLLAIEPINLDGPSLLPKAEIFTTPRSGEFLVGSTFDVPIYINTENYNINTINVKLSFNPTKLSIVKPSGGKSIFGIWLEPPTYDNKKGTASFVGVIPNGIVTSSGLIATVTFKAMSVGDTKINITDYSSANLNDGVGSVVRLNLNGSNITINPKIPDGVLIYSDTHPYQDHWYNNKYPTLKWEAPIGVNGYSVVFDLNPNTNPPPVINTNNAFISYENLKDGMWYLHVRANVNGVWGSASHFQVKIDTLPPADFTPKVDILKDNYKSKKYLLSFLTTDSLSSIDHYEIGILSKDEEELSSPIFVQTESPYVLSDTTKNTHVIIRVYDKALNMREVSIDLYPGVTWMIALKKYSIYIFIIIIFILLMELLLHYLFGHHIIDHIKKMFVLFKKISADDQKYQAITNKIDKINTINTPPSPPSILPIKPTVELEDSTQPINKAEIEKLVLDKIEILNHKENEENMETTLSPNNELDKPENLVNLPPPNNDKTP